MTVYDVTVAVEAENAEQARYLILDAVARPPVEFVKAEPVNRSFFSHPNFLAEQRAKRERGEPGFNQRKEAPAHLIDGDGDVWVEERPGYFQTALIGGRVVRDPSYHLCSYDDIVGGCGIQDS